MVGERIRDNLNKRASTVKESIRLFKESSVADAVSNQVVGFGINNRALIRSFIGGFGAPRSRFRTAYGESPILDEFSF